MIITTADGKATSIASTGLLASITQDPNFLVLFATAIIVSSMSFYYDLNDENGNREPVRFAPWTKYIIGGQALMFLTFHGLSKWVPEQWQLPDTVWYMLAMVSAGYSTNIIRWTKKALPAVADTIIKKVVK